MATLPLPAGPRFPTTSACVRVREILDALEAAHRQTGLPESLSALLERQDARGDVAAWMASRLDADLAEYVLTLFGQFVGAAVALGLSCAELLAVLRDPPLEYRCRRCGSLEVRVRLGVSLNTGEVIHPNSGGTGGAWFWFCDCAPGVFLKGDDLCAVDARGECLAHRQPSCRQAAGEDTHDDGNRAS